MIYTLTISPSIDYINIVDKFSLNRINRTIDSSFIIGGKGINVSLILKELGMKSQVLGFRANFTGEYLKQQLDEMGISNSLIEVDGFTRINVKILSESETAINADSLIVNQMHSDELKKQINLLKNGDVLIISGNVPHTLGRNLYEDLISNIEKNVRVVIDAEKELLISTLKYHPYLVKPNREEVEEIFGIEIITLEDAYNCAYKLKEKGAQNVIISLDAQGAILVDYNNNNYYIRNVEGKLINSVGAGDSLIAGFIYGVEKAYSVKEAFLLGVACANATAFSVSLAKEIDIYQILSKLKEIN